MNHKQNFCTMCSDIISNPVCERCYTQEIAQWLKDMGIGLIPMKIVLKKIKEKLSTNTLNEHTCILCGRETLSECGYCFFLKVTKILKEMNFPDKIVDRFLEIFNYRHYHEDYYI